MNRLPPVLASGARRHLNLHPLSGLLILGLDWLFFGAEVTLVALPLAVALAFVLTFAGVYAIQRRLATEPRGSSAAKALLGAVLTAAPFPICGSVFGALVIAGSGLESLRRPPDNG